MNYTSTSYLSHTCKLLKPKSLHTLFEHIFLKATSIQTNEHYTRRGIILTNLIVHLHCTKVIVIWEAPTNFVHSLGTDL